MSRPGPKREVRAGRGSRSNGLLGRIVRLLDRAAVKDAVLPGEDVACLMEPLEPRLLLSAAVATPDFALFDPIAGVTHASTAAPQGLAPAQIRHAYGIDQVPFGSISTLGAGQTIAIVDAYNAPTIVADLKAFDAKFTLADPVLTVIGQNGSTTLPGTDPSGKGNSWALETSLDVEWAHAVAPGANILLVEANSNSDADLFAAIDTARHYAGVSVISMSWGGGEWSSESYYDQFFTTPGGHTGVTFVASSGDSGAYVSRTTKGVEYPAASPNVLAVGGTYLTVDASGNTISETAWGNGSSSYTSGGSGGGTSQYEAQPAYQKGVVTQTTTNRAVPDVAADADPRSGVAVIDSWDFGTTAPWIQVGGTSLAAPIWAGIIGIADQGRVLAGKTTLDGATQTLPLIYAAPNTDFHDITTGNNGYAAAAGYDLVTGRGTPIVNRLVADLGGTVQQAPTVGTLAASPGSGVSGTTVTLTASNVKAASGTISAVKFYRESNGAAGLQAAADTLIGTGTQSGTNWTISSSTTGLDAGTYTYYAVATDSSNVGGPAASTTFTVIRPTIGSLTVNPSSVSAGASVTLTASGVQETGGAINSVKFYRESNGTSGLQIGADTLLGTGTLSGSAWTITTSTTGLASGVTTFYAVATDGANVASAPVSGTLTITAKAPANDNFAAAAAVTGASFTATGTNVGATKETGEPTIAGNAGGKSVWYVWVAPASGKVSLNTTGSNFDTLLGVCTGSTVKGLTAVAGNDDNPAGRTTTSALTFTAVKGVTYYFVVDGYNAASGSIVLALSLAAAPANNLFTSAAPLSGQTATWTGTNVGATREAGEPAHAGQSGGASVWIAWAATTSRTVTLNTQGSSFDTLLAVYTGSSVSSLAQVASNDDSPAGHTLTSALTFNAVAGTTYYFAVDGYRGATGSITLNLL